MPTAALASQLLNDRLVSQERSAKSDHHVEDEIFGPSFHETFTTVCFIFGHDERHLVTHKLFLSWCSVGIETVAFQLQGCLPAHL